MKKCNVYIEELCDITDIEALNSDCQLCGIKIAFHQRKKIITHITNYYYMSDNFSKTKFENSVEPISRNDIFNLPANLLKNFFIEWLEIENISRLDHALCESKKRKILLEVLNAINLFGLKTFFADEFDTDAYQCYDSILDSYLQWLSKRNIFIKFFILTRFNIVNEYYYRFNNLEELVINLNNETEEFNLLEFKLMLKFCKKLKSISINNCDIFDVSVIESTLKYLNNIYSITINNCHNFSDECLNYLSLNDQNLTEIKLINLSNIEFENFDQFCENFENLKSLTISDCDNFKDNCLFSISKHCKNLEFLSLNELENITDEGLVDYKKCFLKLKTLIYNPW
jgi:hypothetical protein